MHVADLIQSRKPQWEELEALLLRVGAVRKNRRLRAEEVSRLSSLYRGVCADLALAEAYRLPPGTIRYLNDLVGRTHNRLYRDKSVTLDSWVRLLTVETPRLLFGDKLFWFAMLLFWGPFLFCLVFARANPDFADQMLGAEQLSAMEKMFERPFTDINPGERMMMGGFYVYNNAGIGLQCFAYGALTVVGPILITLFNAITLGTIFGYMSTTASAPQFHEFTTAHGPFELTAIVMASAAGMRIGLAMVFTNGLARSDSIRFAAMKALPIISTATVLFCLAAPIEAFLSPDPLTLLTDYGFSAIRIKQGVAAVCTLLLFFYIVVLGGLATWNQRLAYPSQS